MYTRRKFVVMGGMATAVTLALKPFKAAVGIMTPFTGLDNGSKKLIFLHTANPDLQMDYKMIDFIADLQNNNANAIVLHSGGVAQHHKSGSNVYDCCIDEINDPIAITCNYKIIRKGHIKTGLISANPDDGDVIEKVNTLSAFLKKEKACNLVVCLSQLGYKNKNRPDDCTLAKQSTHLDLIIGGNTKNVHQHPVILLNQNDDEVIIHSAVNNSSTFAKIDLDFNELGQKRYIHFSNS